MTVNAELENKLEEVDSVKSDLKNLMNCPEFGFLILDKNMCIRQFSNSAKKLIQLIEEDMGRPVDHIATKLRYPEMYDDIRLVLDSLQAIKKDVETINGEYYQIRISPYLTTEDIMDGVVITFLEVTEKIEKKQELQESVEGEKQAKNYAESIVDTVREPLIILDEDLNILSANRSFYKIFQLIPDDIKGKKIYDTADSQWDKPGLRKLLENILPDKTFFENFKLDDDFPNAGHRTFLLNARKIFTVRYFINAIRCATRSVYLQRIKFVMCI